MNLTKVKMMGMIRFLPIIQMKTDNRAKLVLSTPPHGHKVTGLSIIFLCFALLSDTPEFLPFESKPLLSTLKDGQQPKQRRSSHSLLPLIPSRKSSVRKSVKISHELPVSQQSSYGQAVLNGLVMALIGSLLTMVVTLILPCACYLSILRGKVTCFQVWPRCNLHLYSFMLNITISVTYF
ncbi:Amino acid transporter AVT1C [Camellia lanceoleosa]|uniref:Amino acid transporter AVT1C n=1 Tax=Camellia lanceoleosa TaxID=1840588 RepID=A0ACC0HJN8_9ERIC|nr:Amino acid transporter AVT1C [Camellia lanceoleosa]